MKHTLMQQSCHQWICNNKKDTKSAYGTTQLKQLYLNDNL